MIKKNYLTGDEQEVWRYVGEKEIVDNELVKIVFPEMSANKRNKLLHSLYVKGYLNRLRKDLYYNAAKLSDFYKLALKVRAGYIGLSSALRYHNLIEYEDFTIFVMTLNYRKKLPLKGTQYYIQFIPLNSLFAGFEKKGWIYVSSIEKTIFDCLLKPRFVGFTNISKALYEARLKLDWNKFVGFFGMTKNSSLCQRTGYLLELLKRNTKLDVPPFVFELLQKRVKNPVKFTSSGGSSTFNSKWKVEDNLGEKSMLSWWY